MIGLLQRVSRARVEIDAVTVAAIEAGLAVLIGVERDDTRETADRLLHTLLGYRVFPDSDGKMNLGLDRINGGLLLIPQFTLAADTRKGMRPSFSRAAPLALGQGLFDYLVQQARGRHPQVQAGRFGADMQVSLTNDGPVTFWLQV